MAEIVVQGTEKDEKPQPPELSLRFPLKGDVQPQGFEKLTLNGESVIMVRGIVTRLESDPESKWEPGKSLTLRVTACQAAPVKDEETAAKTIYPDMKGP